MSEIQTGKILKQLSESEIKCEHWCAKTKDNLEKLWSPYDEILQERLTRVEKEMTIQKKLKHKIQKLKNEIVDSNGNQKFSENKICEFEALVNETDDELRRQRIEEKKLKQHYESRKMELGKLEKVKNLLQTHQSLYDHCLSTRLCCEPPDLFTLSFMNDEKCIGSIKFDYEEDKNRFEVTEIDPKDLVSDSILNKFHETQDTQGLLCLIYQNLPRY